MSTHRPINPAVSDAMGDFFRLPGRRPSVGQEKHGTARIIISGRSEALARARFIPHEPTLLQTKHRQPAAAAERRNKKKPKNNKHNDVIGGLGVITRSGRRNECVSSCFPRKNDASRNKNHTHAHTHHTSPNGDSLSREKKNMKPF